MLQVRVDNTVAGQNPGWHAQLHVGDTLMVALAVHRTRTQQSVLELLLLKGWTRGCVAGMCETSVLSVVVEQ